MKKLSKIIAAVLLLALCVSAFAGFSIFAATDDETAAAPGGRVVAWSMNDYETISLSGAKEGDSITKMIDADGNVYWQQTYGTSGHTVFWNVFLPGVANDNSVIFADIANVAANDDGNYTPVDSDGDGKIDIRYEKNTDFFVIDFDISTDSCFVPGIQLHNRTLSDRLSSSLANVIQDASTYNSLNKGTGENDGFNINGISNPYETGNKWTNVTIVYDVTADFDHAAIEAGGAAPEYAAYIYVDGYYVGEAGTNFYRNNQAGSPSTASVKYGKLFESIRMETFSSVAPIEGATTNYANFTISKFPVGFDGMIDDEGVLGSRYHTLHSIPELHYCLENTPGTPEGYSVPKIADITRTVDGEVKTIPVFSPDELHGDLLAGDVVTVYTNVKAMKAAYAVKMVAGETEEVLPEISWVDKNGITLGEEGSLFAAPVLVGVPSDADWAFIQGTRLVSSGSNVTIANGAGSAAYVVDPLFNVLPESGTNDIILFNDYIMYGPSAKAGYLNAAGEIVAEGDEGAIATTAKGSSANRFKGSYTIDLNGHTFVSAAAYQHLFLSYAANTRLTLKNGSLIHKGSYNLMAVTSEGYTTVTSVTNCDVTIETGKTIFDQRTGLTVYNNCNITANSALTNIKAYGDGKSFTVAQNSTITGTAENLIHCGQINAAPSGSSTKYRRGSCNLFSSFYNCDVDVTGSIVFNEVYANKGHTEEECKANKCNYYLSVFGGEISTYGVVANTGVKLLPKEGENILAVNVDIDIYDADVEAFSLVSASATSFDPELLDLRNSVDISGSYKLYRVEKDGDKTYGGFSNANEGTAVTINVAEGTTFNNVNLYRPNHTGIATPVVNLPAGVDFAYTSAYGEDINLIATSESEEYSYVIDGSEPETFLWEKPAEGTPALDINKVVAGVSGVYHYDWTVSEDGKTYTAALVSDLELDAKANLTIWDDFTFNLYVPVSLVENTAVKVFVNSADGAALTAVGTVEIDGVLYNKYQVYNIAPTMVEDTAFVFGYTVANSLGREFAFSKDIAVIDYLAEARVTDVAEDRDLIAAIINYIIHAYYVAGKDPMAVENIKSGPDYVIDSYDDAKLGELAGVEVAINYGTRLGWAIKAAEGTEIKVTYLSGGEEQTVTLTAGENGIVYLYTSARDFFGDFTVTVGEASAVINVKGYYEALGDGAEKNLVSAIYGYAKEAAEYTLPEAPTPEEPAPEEGGEEAPAA